MIEGVQVSDDSVEDAGYYIFMDEVSPDTCSSAIKFVLAKNLQPTEKRVKEIRFLISSPGGCITSCFALLDVMASSRIPITTFGLGGVASCGLLLFMAGDTRVLSPNTSVLSHQFNWGTRGKEHELVADRVEQDNTSDRILAHYKSCTGLTEKLIKAELLGPSDTWLTAKQALKYNLCDHVKTFRM